MPSGNPRALGPARSGFISQDTYLGEFKDPMSLNLYAYVKDNPLTHWDPTGHMAADDAGAGGGIPGGDPYTFAEFWNDLMSGVDRTFLGTSFAEPTEGATYASDTGLDNPVVPTVTDPNAYERPSGYRKGVRAQVWEAAKDSDGVVRDPLTGKEMSSDEPWDMGHKPGYEFRKFAASAEERGLNRQEFLDEYNNPDHYRPELRSSNRSHRGEDMSDAYLGLDK